MFEALFEALPEGARACRALYDAESGGYHLPLREHNRPLTMADVPSWRAEFPQTLYDCVEVPVADLLYTLVVNTRSASVLETGTSRGFSTCHLAAGARVVSGAAAEVVTIDVEAVPHRFFEGSSLEAAIAALQGDSLALDPDEVAAGRDFDFMFFDSLHTYAHLAAEVARYLPRLRLGGLFALHDTFVFDALGLVVLALAHSGRVEMLSMSSHRRHAHPARSPGVSLFRKIAPIAPGELRFPDLGDAAGGEQHGLVDAAAIATRTGALFADRRYHAQRLGQEAREATSPALLEPQPPTPC